jgi:hypothetical protein
MGQPWQPGLENIVPISVVINDLEMYDIDRQMEQMRER